MRGVDPRGFEAIKAAVPRQRHWTTADARRLKQVLVLTLRDAGLTAKQVAQVLNCPVRTVYHREEVGVMAAPGREGWR